MPPSWDLSRHIQLAVLMLILLGILAITVRVDFWEDYSSNKVSKDVEEMQQLMANQQEALRKDEENRRLAKLKDFEERRAVLEPGKCAHYRTH
jgi:1,4-dihydroxy-2-naphthoate octaprenyltransferase